MLGALQLLCISVHPEEVQNTAIASVLHANNFAHSGEDLVQCNAVWLFSRLIHRRRHDANHQGQYGDKPVLDALRAHSESLAKHPIK